MLYLMSVVRSAGDYLFFFGEGDELTSMTTLSESRLGELLADSISIGLDEFSQNNILGEYVYQHVGLFRRTIVLKSDGSIENGGDHDSHWRIERFGERTELWVFGSSGLSCRLQPTGPDDWSGIWNHGRRPRVTITRPQAKSS